MGAAFIDVSPWTSPQLLVLVLTVAESRGKELIFQRSVPRGSVLKGLHGHPLYRDFSGNEGNVFPFPSPLPEDLPNGVVTSRKTDSSPRFFFPLELQGFAGVAFIRRPPPACYLTQRKYPRRGGEKIHSFVRRPCFPFSRVRLGSRHWFF